MRYTVIISKVQVIGKIWMPATTCAYEYTLSNYDIGNLDKPITRESVEDWLAKNAGDFQSIEDFCANIAIGDEDIEIPWHNEESELTYSDLMYGSPED